MRSCHYTKIVIISVLSLALSTINGWQSKVEASGHMANLPQSIKSECELQGWLNSFSFSNASTAALHISSTQKTVDVSIARYSKNIMGNRSNLFSKTVRNVEFHSPMRQSKISTFSGSDWPISLQFHISNDWKSGLYLVSLQSGKCLSYVPFVVRGTTPGSRTLVISLLTSEAYNAWGGVSLYRDEGSSGKGAVITSLDRPLDHSGLGNLSQFDFPLIDEIESSGEPFNYIVDTDFATPANIPLKQSAFYLDGHSEYWSEQMRDNLELEINSGSSLINFGSNALYNRPIYDSVSHIMTIYRWGNIPDPNGLDPALSSTIWRMNPIARPESMILGAQYVGITKGETDLQLQNTWPFLKVQSDTIRNVVGSEVDSPLYSPGPKVISLASSETSIREKSATMMSTIYFPTENSYVLNIGTDGWVCGMYNNCAWSKKSPADSKMIRKITDVIIETPVDSVIKNFKGIESYIPARALPFDEWSGIVDHHI